VMENAIDLENYIYLFTTDESYYIANADVNRSSGARVPSIFSRKYTTQSTRTATEMDGRVLFVDLAKKRVIRSQVNLSGRLEPDESFDAPVRNLLKRMDRSQPFALTYYWEEANYALIQLSIEGQLMILVWDNNQIVTEDGVSEGRWLPPVLNWQVKGFFTKQGQLFGTDLYDDTVFQFAVSESDDGADIESVFATGLYEIGEGRALADWGDWEVSGGLTQGTEAVFTPYVTEKAGTPKPISSAGLDFESGVAIGRVPVGESFTPGADATSIFAKFDKSLKVAPAKGRSFQAVVRCEGDGQAMRIDSWKLPKVKFYSSSVTSRT
jgi:hypothetical protein